MSGHLRGVVAITCAAVFVMTQPAAAEPFCDFINQVLAAKDGGFASLRGAATDTGAYEGTLKPSHDGSCSINPMTDGTFSYRCYFGDYAQRAEGERDYNNLTDQMRRCFPDASFEEKMVRPEGDSSLDTNALFSTVNGHKVNLLLTNGISVTARIFETMLGEPTTPLTYSFEFSLRPQQP